MENDIIKEMQKKMEKSCEALRNDLAKLRTGRASISLLDGIHVEYYGVPTPLNQVASITAPEARLIIVQPWDATLLKPIEKAILASGLGLNPANDGKILRIPIPELTEERRKELVKIVKKHAEDSKVIVRNIRRDANEAIKKQEKNSEITEDEMHKFLEDIQKHTDDYIKKIDEIAKAKEKEIMEI